jgi:hypothetical protein
MRTYEERLKMVKNFLWVRLIKSSVLALKIGKPEKTTKRILSGDLRDEDTLHKMENFILRGYVK